jgi:hypothetical protein
VGDSGRHVDRRRGGPGPRSCIGTRLGNHDRSAALRLPRRGALRYVRRFGSAACDCRNRANLAVGPAPADGSAEHDLRFRAEEKLAVYLAGVARLIRTESAEVDRRDFRFELIACSDIASTPVGDVAFRHVSHAGGFQISEAQDRWTMQTLSVGAPVHGVAQPSLI